MKRIVIALVAVSLLGGCGVLGKDKKKVTPTVGERIPVLSRETVLEVDPALAGIAVTLPPATANDAWAQPGGNAAKSMVHLTLGGVLSQAWRVSIGEGSTNKGQLTESPVVADGKVFTIEGKKTPSYGEDKSFITSLIESI